MTDDKASIKLTHASVDVLEFLRLATSDDIASLHRAVDLYRGELLADTTVQDPAFEDWVGAERQQLAEVAIGVIERLCRNETGPARTYLAKRLVAIDQLREASHVQLMHAYLDAGERALALRQYSICRKLLREELQISPSEQIEAVRRSCLESTSVGSVSMPENQSILKDRSAVTSPLVVDRPLVAVLPIQAFSSNTGLDSFCDGLTEDITTGLTRIASIRVVARITMFTYKHRAVDVRSIGRELGARYVLEGSVRTSGGNIRVTAQLIDAVSGHHIWAEQIDRANMEEFALQNDITQTIVGSVQTQLSLNEGRMVFGGAAETTAAPLLALAWRSFLGLTEVSLKECRLLSERALTIEPNNVTAHRMLAVALYHQVYMGFATWDEQTIGRIFSHAKVSVEGEGADEYSHWAMECAHLLRKEHELAAASLQRALEINPNFVLAYGSMGTVLAWGGNYDESVRNNEIALRANPQDTSNFFRHFGLALAHYLAMRPEKALTHARIVSQARSNWMLAQIIYAAILVENNRVDEARKMIRDMRTNRPDFSGANLSMLPFAKEDDREHLMRDLRSAGLE